MLNPHHVTDAYRQAREACRMGGDHLPKASAVQQLVCVGAVVEVAAARAGG
jgi:hypothetical protein